MTCVVALAYRSSTDFESRSLRLPVGEIASWSIPIFNTITPLIARTGGVVNVAVREPID